MMCKTLRTRTYTYTHTHTHIHIHTQVFEEPVLNGFMLLGQAAWSEARQVIPKLLSKDEVSVMGSDRMV